MCCPLCRWRVGYIAYPGQELLAQFGGVQDLGAELLKVGIQGSCICRHAGGGGTQGEGLTAGGAGPRPSDVPPGAGVGGGHLGKVSTIDRSVLAVLTRLGAAGEGQGMGMGMM